MAKNFVQKTPLIAHIAAAVFLGVIIGCLYIGFETLVSETSDWLWNDVVQSDMYRWRVIPLTVLLSVVLTILIRTLGKKRIDQTSSSLLDELQTVKNTTAGDIGVILAIGALSLIAGASLGPEASLVSASLGVSALLSKKLHITKLPTAIVFSYASLGALLAAFFNSFFPIIIPLLLLKQKGKLSNLNITIVLSAVFTAVAITKLIKN